MSKKNLTQSQHIMNESQKIFPGGVNSPVRSFRSVGGTPLVFSHGQGKHLFDMDGNCYVDFCSSWGPLILGYSHPAVVEAMQTQIAKAVTFGAPSLWELKLGEKIKSWIPQIDLLRFVNSGTEATMSAVRVARAATGKNKIVKFEGCYHGHADLFLVKAGSGLATLGNTSSKGVPLGTTQDTITAIYNSAESMQEVFATYGNDIAAVILEPLAANMGLVPATKQFVQLLRDLTQQHGCALIFDEVMTGFRLARGGAAEHFGITPDLWTFGKVIGGGLPAAAYGGRREFMEHVAPLGGAYQAGTLSGNPLAMCAGYTTLCEMERENVFSLLEKKGKQLDAYVAQELTTLMERGALCYVRVGSFFCFFFGTNRPPQNFSDVANTNMSTFNKVYHALLEEGIYLGPSGFEVCFLSTCIEDEDMQKLVRIIKTHASHNYAAAP